MDKVLVTNASFAKFNKRAQEILESYGLEVVKAKQPVTDESELLDYLDNVVAIITGLEPVSGKIINAATDLKVIAKHGIGVNNIDLCAAKEKGIIVLNSPGTNREAVADLVFGLMISLARKIPKADKLVREGKWSTMFGNSVSGRTLGIIGLGAIGKSVATRAKGFNMKVLAYDSIWDDKYEKTFDVIYSSIDDILKSSDYITIHVPLIDETKNLIGASEIEKMKESAYLINCSRGGIVDEDALYYALKENKIAGAALDVFSTEPPVNSSLMELENTVFTPHMGGFTDGALGMTSEFIANTVIDALEGKSLINRVV